MSLKNLFKPWQQYIQSLIQACLVSVRVAPEDCKKGWPRTATHCYTTLKSINSLFPSNFAPFLSEKCTYTHTHGEAIWNIHINRSAKQKISSAPSFFKGPSTHISSILYKHTHTCRCTHTGLHFPLPKWLSALIFIEIMRLHGTWRLSVYCHIDAKNSLQLP